MAELRKETSFGRKHPHTKAGLTSGFSLAFLGAFEVSFEVGLVTSCHTCSFPNVCGL